MIKYPSFSDPPSARETKWGFAWLGFQLIILPVILVVANIMLPNPLSDGMVNVVYYIINATVIFFLFRQYLTAAWRTAMERLPAVIWRALLGYLGYQALTSIVTLGITLFYPDFANVNDQNIFEMLEKDTIPLALGTVLLVPIAEETLYRGLLFRNLAKKNMALAFAVSMVAFAAIHVMGYIGTFPPTLLVLCFVQYLPAGFCLAWCYRQTGTIVTPILMHTLVNAVSIYYAIR